MIGLKTGLQVLRRIKQKDIQKISILVIVVSSQLFYGLSYIYINERYMSTHDLETLEWMSKSNLPVYVAMIYRSWQTTGIPRAVLYPKGYFVNDDARVSLTTLETYLQDRGRTAFIVVKEYEAIYLQLMSAGYEEVYTNEPTHVFVYYHS